MLSEYVNKGCAVLIDDRGEIVHMGRPCWLTPARAEQILAAKPGAIVPAAANATGSDDAAPVDPSPPSPGTGAASEDSDTAGEADAAESKPESELEQEPEPEAEPGPADDMLDAVLALHHSKRKQIAKRVTGKKLSASRSDTVIKALTPDRLAEVVRDFLEG